MLVAQIVHDPPSNNSQPPGPTEQMMGWLCDGLRRRGHEVVELTAPVDLTELMHFDLIHAHAAKLTSLPAASPATPLLYTLHGRLDRPTWRHVDGLDSPSLVSISDLQRRPLESLAAKWMATIPDPVDLDVFSPRTAVGSYLAYVGGMGPLDGVEQAVELAEVTGVPLRVAAGADLSTGPYWQDVLSPLFRSAQVEYVGLLEDRLMANFLAGAFATVFPTAGPDPSPRPMIESLACGTPVIAATAGPGSEVVEDGLTGYLSDTIEGMSRAVDEVGWLDRDTCRLAAARFGTEPTVERYEQVYQDLLAPAAHDGLTTAV